MWDVLYAIDASTSMGEETKNRVGAPFVKMDAVKDGILRAVSPSVFPFGARVGVMAFRGQTRALGTMLDSSKDVAQELLSLTPVVNLWANPAILRDSLDALRVGGMTPTGEGLRRALEMIYPLPREQKERIKNVILVTDESSNAGRSPDGLLDAGAARRAMVDVVYLGKRRGRKSLESIARKTGGKYTEAEDPFELSAVLKPTIPYIGGHEPDPLLMEAERVSAVLKATEQSSVTHNGVSEAVADVRAKVEQKLRELVLLEGKARANADLVVSGTTHDAKWPTMSMREFADRVWSSVADLERLEALSERHRRALRSLFT
jgi:Mg-chelatase subunit ChlD